MKLLTKKSFTKQYGLVLVLLAASGWLDGRRVVTHWTRCEQLAAQHPNLHVEANPIFINDGPVWTSAGVTAGIDLALALVEADLGRPIALAVARRLVMFLRRPGGQAQFSALLTPEPSRVPRLSALLEWIPLHLSEDLSLPALAAQAHMTPRTLSRVFVQELGMGPGRYVERIRLETARTLLQSAQASIGTVARLSGFAHAENLRRSFHKHLGISPQDYCERFA